MHRQEMIRHAAEFHKTRWKLITGSFFLTNLQSPSSWEKGATVCNMCSLSSIVYAPLSQSKMLYCSWKEIGVCLNCGISRNLQAVFEEILEFFHFIIHSFFPFSHRSLSLIKAKHWRFFDQDVQTNFYKKAFETFVLIIWRAFLHIA